MYLPKATLLSTITNIEDDGGGAILVTAPAHGLTTGYVVVIYGVNGTTEANGTWAVTVTSSSQFTLDSSTFSNTWTSGGGVYAADRVFVTKSAHTATVPVMAFLKYLDVGSGFVSDINRTLTNLTSTSATQVAIGLPTYSVSVHLLNIYNAQASSTDFTVTYKDYQNNSYVLAKSTIASGSRSGFSPDIEPP